LNGSCLAIVVALVGGGDMVAAVMMVVIGYSLRSVSYRLTPTIFSQPNVEKEGGRRE
jgi:hypothetical protein